MSHWTMQVPVLSTAHVSRQTMTELERGTANRWQLRVAAYDTGVFIMLLPTWLDGSVELPVDIRDLLTYLRTPDGELLWLRLDADGDTIDSLPTYDW